MQSKSGDVHVGDHLSRIKPSENVAQFNGMFCNYAALIVVFIKALQPFNAESTVSLLTVTRNVTDVKAGFCCGPPKERASEQHQNGPFLHKRLLSDDSHKTPITIRRLFLVT